MGVNAHAFVHPAVPLGRDSRNSTEVGGSWWIGVGLQRPANEERIVDRLGSRIINRRNERDRWKR